jgi:hypothetical protein
MRLELELPPDPADRGLLDSPLCSAIDFRDQWVAFFGISSSVVTTTAST